MRDMPAVIVFDVNETLSDMAPLRTAFTTAGMSGDLARVWFTEILRDGFALAAAGDSRPFADLAADILRRILAERVGDGERDQAADAILGTFRELQLHADVNAGIDALRGTARLVTLTNGAASVADSLLTRAGVRDAFERLLSVEDAARWKPARAAYDYVVQECGEPADRMLLVAVHPWDIHGAKAAGLKAAWINRSGGGYPSYFTGPDLQAPSLPDLAAQLRAIRG